MPCVLGASWALALYPGVAREVVSCRLAFAALVPRCRSLNQGMLHLHQRGMPKGHNAHQSTIDATCMAKCSGDAHCIKVHPTCIMACCADAQCTKAYTHRLHLGMSLSLNSQRIEVQSHQSQRSCVWPAPLSTSSGCWAGVPQHGFIERALEVARDAPQS